jgi:hypothetical protein
MFVFFTVGWICFGMCVGVLMQMPVIRLLGSVRQLCMAAGHFPGKTGAEKNGQHHAQQAAKDYTARLQRHDARSVAEMAGRLSTARVTPDFRLAVCRHEYVFAHAKYVD